MKFRDTFGGMEGINKIKNGKESKKIFQGAGQNAQWQRALAVIAEDLGLTPGTLMVAHNQQYVCFQGIQSPLLPSENTRHGNSTHVHMQTKHKYI